MRMSFVMQEAGTYQQVVVSDEWTVRQRRTIHSEFTSMVSQKEVVKELLRGG